MDPQEIIEGFAVETVAGSVFTVKGLLHPPDRVIAYLRYLPDPEGDRERHGTPYRRLYHFQDQWRILRSRFPNYMHDDPVFGIRVQSVPRSEIEAVYDPTLFLATLRRRGAAGAAEADALALTQLFQGETGIPWENLGVTGSIMLGMHRPQSDIDLLVYGEAAGQLVHRTLFRLLDTPDCPVRRPSQDELATLHTMHRTDTPLSLADFCRLQRRKVNEGRFRGREYFIRFVKHPPELDERYGDCRFEALGIATVRMRVMDARESIFTPCRYWVEKVRFLQGEAVDSLKEAVSFRGRFSDQAHTGEWVEARGCVERVTFQTGASWHRLVIGGKAGDYLLTLETV